jgi:hypothetical protein
MSGERKAQDKLLPFPFCFYNINKCPNFNKARNFLNTSAHYQWERTSLNHSTYVLVVGSLLYMVKSFEMTV